MNWQWSGELFLGKKNNAEGTLEIRDGASASGSLIHLGYGVNSMGSVLVDGKGSSLTTNTDFLIGDSYNDSKGALTISNGGRVDVKGRMAIGNLINSNGNVVVTGEGSSLNSGSVFVGNSGVGHLTVSDGGQVDTQYLNVGTLSGSRGTVTITGQGSAWNGEKINVGGTGSGWIYLSDGGSINGSSLQIRGNASTGATGEVGVGGRAGEAAQASGNLNVDRIVFDNSQKATNSSLSFNTTNGTTVRAAISGRGAIDQIAGTTVLTGDNSAFIGGLVRITGGMLQLGDGGTSGNLAVDVSTGSVVLGKGVLAFNRSDDVTFSNVISGTGSVTQMGAGTTTLTEDNTYSGGTTIAGGTLSVSSDAKLGNADGGLTLDGGTLQVTGTQYTSTDRTMTLGSHGGGFDIADASNSFAVTQALSGDGRVWKRGDGTLLLSGGNSFSGGLTVEKGTAQAGVADHAFGSGLLTVNDGAKADLAGFNTTVGGLAGAGNVAMRSGDLTLDQAIDTTFAGVIDGSGSLTKNGLGDLTLSGTSSYSGATNVNEGKLIQAAQGALSGASVYTVANGSGIDLGGFSTSMAALINDGHVNFGGNGGTTLNVTGNYAGNGGMMTINTVLGGDDSKTDMLKVGGNTSGSTKLYVNNVGGTGAQTVNGIKVVDIGGNSGGTFSLANSYQTKDGQQAVVGGAYAYTLQQGGTNSPDDGDWYLSSHVDGPDPVNPDTPSQPRYSAGVPVYEGYAQNMLALNKLPTLQQRVGNRYWTGENGNGADNGAVVDNYGIWARVEGAHNRLEPDTSTSRMKQDINTLTMQAGVDGQFYEGENGKLIAGITGQYGHAKGDVSSFHGDGDISTDAWSLGATATWYGNDGLYVDGQAQVTWFDNDLNSTTANKGLADGSKATGYAMSLEAGQRFAINQSWSLTPQAQLMWSSIDADAFHDTWGSRVSLHDGDSLTGRIGLAANYRNDWKNDDGMTVNTNVYGIANLYQQFLGGTTVNVAGVDFDTDNDKTWGGIGAGGTYAWADNKYAIYGEGSINTALNHFADSYALKGTVGFKAKW
ncbi:autotransporter outer membrane beta-barrel domain-containing protein [Ochrobactrum quorumnocens]|uniref:Autotransporter outer membrane beta-barrel domain-containing protein n=2 Tax=Ochrobactrum quorumnocens TaxID=271865 RepID=A0A5N1JNG4_9HYPH|nr:autotransporter outer membrane beta-barrel domain-containing protein [[Ochrobactrum] quorumnocens]